MLSDSPIISLPYEPRIAVTRPFHPPPALGLRPSLPSPGRDLDSIAVGAVRAGSATPIAARATDFDDVEGT